MQAESAFFACDVPCAGFILVLVAGIPLLFVEDRDPRNFEPLSRNGDEEPSATAILLTRAREGDIIAREALFQRFLPVLRRWAHRRLPSGARDLSDTMDLVQITLMRALNRIDRFEDRGEGAFLAYLRGILLNVVREETRRSTRRGVHTTLDETLVSPHASIVERVIGIEQMERYQRGLERLSEEKRQAVILRLEFNYRYDQIADALNRPSPDAARMLVVRALAELVEIIDGR
jgi:RNA polymerase sigma-70 factor (ECF subfamily)